MPWPPSRAAGRPRARALDIAGPAGAVLPFPLHPVPGLLERLPRHRTAHAALIAEILDLRPGPGGFGGTGRPSQGGSGGMGPPGRESRGGLGRVVPPGLTAPLSLPAPLSDSESPVHLTLPTNPFA